MKKKIDKIEHRLQKLHKYIDIKALYYFYVKPTDEEKMSAVEKLMKINFGFPKGLIIFVPRELKEELMHGFRECEKMPPLNLQWDENFGIDIQYSLVIRLVEKYDRKQHIREFKKGFAGFWTEDMKF
jgi:hypothetical protein